MAGEHVFKVDDRVRYDDNFGTVKEVIEGGYRVRYDNGEEIEEMAGDLLPVREIGSQPDPDAGDDLPFIRA